MDTMEQQIYCAPMQGITDYVWRSAHSTVFGGVQYYMSPFLRMEGGAVRKQGLRDVDPLVNDGYQLLPQVLGGRADETVVLAEALARLGYRQVNINLGCPHAPVARRGRGAGLLPHPAEVEAMARALAEALPDVRFSVKMRLGWDDAWQWREVLPALLPLRPSMVAVHPRLGTQAYTGDLLTDAFDALLTEATSLGLPVVYNGGVQSLAGIAVLRQKWPSLAGVMVGRGLVQVPSMLCPATHTAAHYLRFYEILAARYASKLTGGDHQVVVHLQARLSDMLPRADRRLHKAIAKSRTLERIDAAARNLIASYDFAADNLNEPHILSILDK